MELQEILSKITLQDLAEIIQDPPIILTAWVDSTYPVHGSERQYISRTPGPNRSAGYVRESGFYQFQRCPDGHETTIPEVGCRAECSVCKQILLREDKPYYYATAIVENIRVQRSNFKSIEAAKAWVDLQLQDIPKL